MKYFIPPILDGLHFPGLSEAPLEFIQTQKDYQDLYDMLGRFCLNESRHVPMQLAKQNTVRFYTLIFEWGEIEGKR